jgi:hypothetical protein
VDRHLRIGLNQQLLEEPRSCPEVTLSVRDQAPQPLVESFTEDKKRSKGKELNAWQEEENALLYKRKVRECTSKQGAPVVEKIEQWHGE